MKTMLNIEIAINNLPPGIKFNYWASNLIIDFKYNLTKMGIP